MGPYIVDFCCHERRLIVEVDGSVHRTKLDYDIERDRYFTNQNYRVLRVTSDDTMKQLDFVLFRIQTALFSRVLKNAISPSPRSVERGSGGEVTAAPPSPPDSPAQ